MTHAQGLLRAQDDEILVEYRQFCLRDEQSVENLPALAADETVATAMGIAIFCSDANDHYPQIKLESWTQEPPNPAAPWEDDDGIDCTIDLPSGDVRLWALTGGPSRNVFHVGPAGRYLLRVHVYSLLSAVMNDEVEPDDMMWSRAERWLLRFWPAA